MARNGDVMRSDRLKQVMQQIDPNFDERNAGFNRFSKFVVEAGQKGVVQVSKLDNGQFEVAPPAGTPVAAPRPRLPGPRATVAKRPARRTGAAAGAGAAVAVIGAAASGRRREHAVARGRLRVTAPRPGRLAWPMAP